MILFVALPFFGGFYRQLNFYDGMAASIPFVFFSFVLEFEALSVIIIYLILFWVIISVNFIQLKELRTRRIELDSLLINFKSDKKPKDWPFCPIDKLKVWGTMVQGISTEKPLPVRVLLYKDLSLTTAGFAFETWYEAVVMINLDLLKKIPPEAQTALSAKLFGELLGRNFTSLKNEIFWWGLIFSWTFGLIALLIPQEFFPLLFSF